MESLSPFAIRVITAGSDSSHHLSRHSTTIGRSGDADIQLAERMRPESTAGWTGMKTLRATS
jgi:hypothetical protein